MTELNVRNIVTAIQMILVYLGVAFVGYRLILVGYMDRTPANLWLFFFAMLYIFFIAGMLFGDRKVAKISILLFVAYLVASILFSVIFAQQMILSRTLLATSGSCFQYAELFTPLMRWLGFLSPALFLAGQKLLNCRLGNPEKATNAVWEYLMWVRWILMAVGCFALYTQVVWF